MLRVFLLSVIAARRLSFLASVVAAFIISLYSAISASRSLISSSRVDMDMSERRRYDKTYEINKLE
jgi:hypothetical protein